MSLLGTSALGYVRLPRALPLDGNTTTKIQTAIQGLDGTTTVRRRGSKRGWAIKTSAIDPWALSKLGILFDAVGPLNYYDSTRSPLIPVDRKYLRGWRNIATGAELTNVTEDLRLTIPQGVTAGFARATEWASYMVPIPAAGVSGVIGITARSVGSVAQMGFGIAFYTSAGAPLGSVSSNFSLSTTEARKSRTFTSPATAAWANVTVAANGATDVVITDPSVGLLDRSGWAVVHFTDLSVTKNSPTAQFVSATLQEV